MKRSTIDSTFDLKVDGCPRGCWLIEIGDRDGSLRVTVLRAGVIVDLTGNIEHRAA